MRNVKRANAFLWAFNALLGAGIVVFAVNFLILPQEDFLAGFDPDAPGDARPAAVVAQAQNDQALKGLRNPIEKQTAQAPAQVLSSFKAGLRGTMCSKDPAGGIAFIRSLARNTELVAYPGEAILFDGKPYDEFTGWKVMEVYKDRAVFSNGREKAELKLETNAASAAGMAAPGGVPGQPGARVNRQGQPYQPGNFKSQKLSATDNREVWGLDPQEMDWIFQNQEAIMDRDIQVAPYAGGGLRLEGVSGGSVGASRGLTAGDIVRDVNGVPLNSLADIKNLANNPSLKSQGTVRITLERAGKPMVLEYRPLGR
jgi:hypothetical protein